MRPTYLDYNARTPIAPEVAEAMRPVPSRHYVNPVRIPCRDPSVHGVVLVQFLDKYMYVQLCDTAAQVCGAVACFASSLLRLN
jgi:hypothetical protein